MIGYAYRSGEKERVATGLKKIGENTYMIDCKACGKSYAWYGFIENYRYKLLICYRRPSGGHGYRKAYCCSWSCYLKELLQSTAEKEVLLAQDVILLLRYKKDVPWDKVAKVAWEQLPPREELESAGCYLR